MTHRLLVTILGSFLLMQAVAAAQSPPPTFSYKITMSGGTGTGSMDYTMDVTIKDTSPDGSRHASVTIHAPKMPPIDNKAMDATLSPVGAITIGSTGEMPKHFNPYNIAQMKQMQQFANGPMMQSMINPLNAFANGLTSAPSFKTGTTWQAHSDEAMADVTYIVTGHEQRGGHDTAVITMKSSSRGPSVTGRGNYDLVSHLVVAAHSEIRQTADAKQGEVLDVAMSVP